MCLAAPSRVVAVDGDSAIVDTLGSERRVSLLLIDEPVAVGDWVLVQLGRFATERLDEDRAREALALIDSVVASGAADVNAWT